MKSGKQKTSPGSEPDVRNKSLPLNPLLGRTSRASNLLQFGNGHCKVRLAGALKTRVQFQTMTEINMSLPMVIA